MGRFRSKTFEKKKKQLINMFKKELRSKKNIWKNTNKNYAIVRNHAKINLAFGGKR